MDNESLETSGTTDAGGKAAETSGSAGAGGSGAFVTAAEALDIGRDAGVPVPGLSQAPGLREVPNSPAFTHSDGRVVSHVMGPGQAAVDPYAAGLDITSRPLSLAENRAVTHTGGDGSTTAAPSDREAERAPGPTGGVGAAAEPEGGPGGALDAPT